MRPLIALASRFTDRADTWRVPATAVGLTYQDAIVRAGGQPVALAPIRETIGDLTETLSRFDGLLLPGGPDVGPHHYGADEVHPAVYGVDARHDAFDLALARVAVELGLPVLAICRGHQVLNVALGGTLIQHLGDDVTTDHRFQRHAVVLQPGCRAALAMGTDRPVGHSVHHQAIDRVADGMLVTGRADDGTIEAIESVDGWVVSVQWHPEDDAHELAEQQGLFDAFVAACTSRAAVR
ncbi:MAG: gamma-glutamyl-gamma-aminobutyrate hydrolase family protein [Ilumatobacteraceae bacterium]